MVFSSKSISLKSVRFIFFCSFLHVNVDVCVASRDKSYPSLVYVLKNKVSPILFYYIITFALRRRIINFMELNSQMLDNFASFHIRFITILFITIKFK